MTRGGGGGGGELLVPSPYRPTADNILGLQGN